jgi:hypothetical protein
MRRPLSIAILLLAQATASLAAPRIEVSISPTEVTIGDRIEMVVTVLAESPNDSAAVRFQAWEETLGPAEILEVFPVEQFRGDGDQAIFRQRLALTVFRLGEVTLPPVEAAVVDQSGETPLTSVSSQIVVRSVLPDEAETVEAKPPAPPARRGLGDAFWWVTGAMLATCLVAIVALWRQTDEVEAGEDGRPRLAPIDELRRSLAALRHESEIEPIHAEVSLAVRRFLGRVVDFPAAESTTTEVRRELRRRNLSADVVRQTNDLLSRCDLVMFARQEVPLDTARACIDDARSVAEDVLAEYRSDPTEAADGAGEAT